MDHEPDWVTAPLTADRIDQAYPLVQACERSLSLDQWRTQAANALSQGPHRSGIVTALRRGYIHGLFRYRIDDDGDAGPVLVVDMVRVLDIIDPSAANRVLRQAMARTATNAKCVTIRPPLGGHGLKSNGAGPSDRPCPIIDLAAE